MSVARGAIMEENGLDYPILNRMEILYEIKFPNYIRRVAPHCN